ncbi:glycosyl hydrolase family protein, partial [bacterium]|nr:glycosyl hydrolase family protein [bacterium]
MFLFGDRAGKQDEIDVEIFGKDASNGRWEMQTNYFRNGEMGGCWEPYGIPEPCHVAMIPLNFDPTESFHNYTIGWIGNGEKCSAIKWFVDDTLRRHVWLDETGYIWSEVFDENGAVIEASDGYMGSLPAKGSKIFLNLWAAKNWTQAGQFNYIPGNPITAQFDWITCYQPSCIPPGNPFSPSGPISGVTGTSYIYSTSATDPGGDQVKYTFDWGDGTIQTETGLVNSGITASATHSWSAADLIR